MVRYYVGGGIVLAALVAGFVLSAFFSDGITSFGSSVRSFFEGDDRRGYEVSFGRREDGTLEARGADQQVAEEDVEGLRGRFLRGGDTNNFELVRGIEEGSALRRLSQGVGQLVFLRAGAVVGDTCTGFLISESHVLTAGHCVKTASADGVSGKWLDFDEARIRLGYLKKDDKKGTVELTLHVRPKKEKGVHPDTDVHFKPGLREPDYALLVLDAGEFEEKVRKPGLPFHPVDIARSALEPQHEFVVLHHPEGQEMIASRRYCRLPDRGYDPNDPYPPTFAHICDTLGGSSGAPVFSRAHEAVTAIHFCCEKALGPRAADAASGFNYATHIEAVAQRNLIVRKRMIKDPLTAIEQRVVDLAKRRSIEARQELAGNNIRLAAHLALDGFEDFPEQVTPADPISIATRDPLATLANAVFRLPQFRRIPHLGARLSKSELNTTQSLIVTWDDSGAAHAWGLDSMGLLASFKHKEAVRGAKFLLKDHKIVSWDANSIAIWSLDGEGGLEKPIAGAHKARNSEVTVSDDGSRVLSRSDEGVAVVLSAETGDVTARISHDKMTGAAFSREGVVTWGTDGTLRSWRLQPLSESILIRAPEPIAGVIQMAAGACVIAWTGNERAMIRRAANSQSEARETLGPPATLDFKVTSGTSPIMSPDGKLALLKTDAGMRVWEVARCTEKFVLPHDRGASFSRDNSKILTTGSDKTARVWNAATGIELARQEHKSAPAPEGDIPEGLRCRGSALNTFPGDGAAFSPSGESVVSWGPLEGSVRVWEAASGTILGSLNYPTDDVCVSGAKFSPGGSYILSAGDRRFDIWWPTRIQPSNNMVYSTKEKKTFALSDDDLFLAASDSARFSLASLQSGQEVQEFYSETFVVAGPYRRHEFLNGGRLILELADGLYLGPARLPSWVQDFNDRRAPSVRGGISARLEASNKIVDTNDNLFHYWRSYMDFEREAFIDPRFLYPNAAFSADGRRVLSWGHGEYACVDDVESGAEISCLKHGEVLEGGWARGAAFLQSQDVLSWGRDGTINIWNPDTRVTLQSVAHMGDVLGAARAPDDDKIFSWDATGSSLLWSAASGKTIAAIEKAGVLRAEFSSDGTRLLAWGPQDLFLIDARSGAHLVRLSEPIARAGFSPTGRNFLVWVGAGVSVRNAQSGKEERLLPASYSDPVWSPDGRLLLLDEDAALVAYDLESGDARYKIDLPRGRSCDDRRGVALSPDGKLMAALGRGAATVADASSGKVVRQISRVGGCIDGSLGFTPDTRRVLLSLDGELRSWDIESGRQVAVYGEMRPIDGEIKPDQLLFFDEGRKMLSTREPLTVWDVETGGVVAELVNPSRVAFAATISADGRRALTSAPGLSGSVQLWNLPPADPEQLIEEARSRLSSLGLALDECIAFGVSPPEQSVSTSEPDDRALATCK